jgi:hypothetical protein
MSREVSEMADINDSLPTAVQWQFLRSTSAVLREYLEEARYCGTVPVGSFNTLVVDVLTYDLHSGRFAVTVPWAVEVLCDRIN